MWISVLAISYQLAVGCRPSANLIVHVGAISRQAHAVPLMADS